MFWEISASTGSECWSLLFPLQGDFPNPWNEHLCRGWTLQMSQDSQLDPHTGTHTLGKHNTLSKYGRTLCGHDRFQLLSRSRSLTHFRNYFYLNYTQGAAYCEQFMWTKINVSRKGTWSEIWSDGCAVKKMLSVSIVSFYFITHSLMHSQLSELFGICNWVCENDSEGKRKKQTK